MQDQLPSPAAPRDNLLGICHAIGQTFGFDPIWLRVALMIGLLINFEWTIVAYAVGGIAVLTATLLTGGSGRDMRRDPATV